MKPVKSRSAAATNRALAPLLALALARCAGAPAPRATTPEPQRFTENSPDAIDAIARAVAAHPPATGEPMVVLTAAPPARGLTAFALPSGRRLWESRVPVDARPWLAGDAVVSHANGSVVVFDAATGRERFRTGDRGLSLIGAAGDGQYLAISLARGGLEQRHGVALALDQRTGATRYESEMEQAPGVPTAAGGYAFFPIDGQSVLIVDPGHEAEVARLRAEDDMVSRTAGEGSAVYFGGRVMYRLARAAGTGRREGSPTYALPREDLPGAPTPLAYGYNAAYAGINARERVALVARPDPARDGVHFVDERIYLLFHRVIFALDERTGAVQWAHAHAADVAGAQPVRGALAVVDERGNVAWLDASNGSVLTTSALGATAAQAVFQLPLDAPAPHGAGAEPARPLAETLLAVARMRDNRIVPARVFALHTLAAVPGAEVTHALLEIAGDPAMPPDVRGAAGEALGGRHEGLDALLAALGTHYSYLQQTAPPPVGFIARALAAAHERRATAPLLAALRDPYTPATDLPPLATALGELGDAAAVPGLLEFLVTYHADQGPVPRVGGSGDSVTDRTPAEQEALASAMEQAAIAVGRLGSAADKRRLRELLADSATLPALRGPLEHALAPPPPAPAHPAPAPAANTAHAAPAAPPAPPLPPRPTPENIQQSFGRLRAEMLRCIPREATRPRQLRIRFRYDGEGHVLNPVVTPTEWQACIAPIAGRVHLERSQAFREDGTYFVLGGQ